VNVEWIGTGLAIIGSTISIIGTLYNNLKLDHRTAMKIWAASNPILVVWSIGLAVGWWDGGLPGVALAVMYLVFAVTNFYGLFVAKKEMA
jgi:hypothetical protein